LAEAIHPQWFEQLPATPPSETPRRILLAEDSHFFRTQVAGFLTSAGFEVDEAGDGQEAWDALLEDATPYCLVVSDIEMPRMNGYELCERIKRHAGTASLPVIALTSLSSDEHMRRGREAGFDDYQIKMHRDNLLEAVRRLSAGKAAGGRRGGQAVRRQEACV
jgi:two-component system chemotaxis sensor kinase CheA